MTGSIYARRTGMNTSKKLISIVAAMGFAMTAQASGWNQSGGEKDDAMKLIPDMENGMEVYEVCSACHYPEGWGTKDGTFPQLAGQHKEVLIKQLADIRERNRDNPTMYPFALPESIGDAQALADVVAYIAKLPMNPDNGRGEWAEGTPEFAQGKSYTLITVLSAMVIQVKVRKISTIQKLPASTTSICYVSLNGYVMASAEMQIQTW